MNVPTALLKKTGVATYIYDRVDSAITWYGIAQDAVDPATRENAYYKVAEELSKAAGVGAATFLLEKITERTGLDRVFDSMQNNQTLESSSAGRAAEALCLITPSYPAPRRPCLSMAA